MKYSILIPAYKSEFLGECLQSIFDQTYQDFEVVVLNDFSPDDLGAIVGQFDDDRLRYYENERNVGAVDIVDNWNHLLSLAKGDYVVCMGDDDKLGKNFLEAYNQLMIRYPGLDLYHARTEIIGEKSEFVNLQEDRPDWQSAYAMLWNCIFEPTIQFIGDFLFRREHLLSKGGFYKLPLAWGSDCISSLIAAQEKGCANLHEPTFFYRSNQYSITTSSHADLKTEASIAFYQWVDKFVSEGPTEGLDSLYCDLIKKGYHSVFSHDLRFMMADDMRYHPGHILTWLRRSAHYQTTRSNVIMAFMLGMGLKIFYRK